MITLLALIVELIQAANPAATIKELERIEQQLAATWIAGDCAGWGAMLTPDWSVIHIDASIIPKAKALEMCQAPRI